MFLARIVKTGSRYFQEPNCFEEAQRGKIERCHAMTMRKGAFFRLKSAAVN